MPLLLMRNDITRIKADAIVNPANTQLEEGDGTSCAIYRAAGEKELQEACRKIGGCKSGEAVVTEAFNLNAKYIIHAAGPIFADGKSGEAEMLYHTYWSALKAAEEYHCKSAAFPLLSSGSYRFPKELAMKIAVQAIQDYLWNSDLVVYLVIYDRFSLGAGRRLYPEIEEYIDDHYVDENKEKLETGNERRFELLSSRPMEEPCCKRSEAEAPALRIETSQYVSSLQTVRTRKRSLEDLMKIQEETFSEMLFRLIDEKEMKDSEVYKRANMTRQHFNKLKKKDSCPKKNTVLSLVLALQLSKDEAVDLLARAGYAFSKSSKLDLIIQYFIENQEYDILYINEVLFNYKLPCLGY